MRGLFWILALFAAAVGLALAARVNDGYVLVVFPPWRLEVSLNLLIIGLIAAFAVLHGLLRLVSLTLGLPARVSEFRERRSKDKAATALQDALRHFFEGRYGQSMKRAEESFSAGYVPGLSALVAARAAHALRENAKEGQWLKDAEGDNNLKVARLMLTAEMRLDSRDFSGALDALRQLQETAGRHIAAMRLELKAQQGRKDWEQVLRLARQLQKRDAMAPEQAREIILKAHRENIRQRQEDAPSLLAYLRTIPSREGSPRLAATVARALLSLDAKAEALKVVESTLEKCDEDDWNSDLVEIYGQVAVADADGGELTARIARAEGWLKQRPRDAGLLLALGRLCLQQKLWGKAQNYLEASLSVEESRDAHLELARLLDQLERPGEADRHYRQGSRPDLYRN